MKPADGSSRIMLSIKEHPITRLFQTFILVKVSQLALVYFTPVQFDTSTQLLLRTSYQTSKEVYISSYNSVLKPFVGSIIDNIIEKLVVWDVVYFADLFVNEIKYEHQFVFCPLWWRLIKLVSKVNRTPTNFYQLFIVSLWMSNILHFASVLMIWKLTKTVFNQSLGKFFNKDRISITSGITYILSPGAGFLTSSYSENACAFLCFTGLYLREISMNYENFNLKNSKLSIKDWRCYLLSGIFFAISYGMRANTLLLGIVYLYDLYVFSIKNHSQKDSLWSIISGSFLFTSLLVSNIYTYTVFCTGDLSPVWCSNTIPSLFQYAQGNYWNNGFLSYWTLNNIPNFLFALPTISISMISFKFFLIEYPMLKLLPILLVNSAVLVGGIFFWNTQILTRITTFLPIINWTLSIMILNYDRQSYFVKGFLYYLIIWNIVHVTLFAAFLPPA